jgi:hypothetical protein
MFTVKVKQFSVVWLIFPMFYNPHPGSYNASAMKLELELFCFWILYALRYILPFNGTILLVYSRILLCNLQIQCNSHQNSNVILYRNRKVNPKIYFYWKHKRPWIGQSSLEQK